MIKSINLMARIKGMKPFDNLNITNHTNRLQIIEIVKSLIDSGGQYGFSDDYNIVRYLPVPEITE